MAFPGNQIFPGKIQEISRPEHTGTSSSRFRLVLLFCIILLVYTLFPGFFPDFLEQRDEKKVVFFPVPPIREIITILILSRLI